LLFNDLGILFFAGEKVFSQTSHRYVWAPAYRFLWQNQYTFIDGGYIGLRAKIK